MKDLAGSDDHVVLERGYQDFSKARIRMRFVEGLTQVVQRNKHLRCGFVCFAAPCDVFEKIDPEGVNR